MYSKADVVVGETREDPSRCELDEPRKFDRRPLRSGRGEPRPLARGVPKLRNTLSNRGLDREATDG